MACLCGRGGLLQHLLHSNKAVAVGAVSFYVDHLVTGRISKFTYGVCLATRYKPSNPEHVQREHKSYISLQGYRVVPDCFISMLSRVCHAQSSLGFFNRITPPCRAPKFWRTERSNKASFGHTKILPRGVSRQQSSNTKGLQMPLDGST